MQCMQLVLTIRIPAKLRVTLVSCEEEDGKIVDGYTTTELLETTVNSLDELVGMLQSLATAVRP